MLIITQKVFNDPHVLSHKDIMGMIDEVNKDKELSTGVSNHNGDFVGMKSHDITATRMHDPKLREEMIANDEMHDYQEAVDKYIGDLKANNWKFTMPTTQKEEKTATPSKTQSKKSTPKISVPTKVEETPVQEVTVPEENEGRNGMSVGAKAALGVLGAAASYGAYKAWKKKKAEKAAVDAEVDEFLNNKYKTKE